MSGWPNDDPDVTTQHPQSVCHLVTGSRLHFGLMDVRAPFGGVGVMIDSPSTEIRISPAREFLCEDRDRDRIIAIARRLTMRLGLAQLPDCHVEVTRRPDPHTGLGSGTQLAMACADALCRFCESELPTEELALRIAGRGLRSAVGIHGYFHGGLIHESPSRMEASELNPLAHRAEMPSSWRVALFRPGVPMTTVSGNQEKSQFAKLQPVAEAKRSKLESLITSEMIPAVESADFAAFATALQQYNQQSGELFAKVQGGFYNGHAVTSLVRELVERGATGVGQSSWGPTVFCWFQDEVAATDFLSDFPDRQAKSTIASPRNTGREFTPMRIR